MLCTNVGSGSITASHASAQCCVQSLLHSSSSMSLPSSQGSSPSTTPSPQTAPPVVLVLSTFVVGEVLVLSATVLDSEADTVLLEPLSLELPLPSSSVTGVSAPQPSTTTHVHESLRMPKR
jgi:hypothetical protein